jgi:hypothetical protein
VWLPARVRERHLRRSGLAESTFLSIPAIVEAMRWLAPVGRAHRHFDISVHRRSQCDAFVHSATSRIDVMRNRHDDPLAMHRAPCYGMGSRGVVLHLPSVDHRGMRLLLRVYGAGEPQVRGLPNH